ncbi:MAG: hypothetical protein CL762_01120 [Chloroflexi bacterium]|nr:hypothetical protein [Chloroflexota bacterium]|tara:strand:- start:6184 stop:7524 length:1341 start_codon:yes stop_codon:yes gene_type:complete
MSKIGIWLINKDLRIENNILLRALNDCDLVLPVFIWDEKLRRSSSNSRIASFYHEALNNLSEELNHFNAEILIKSGDSEVILDYLKSKYNVHSIYTQFDVDPAHREFVKNITKKFEVKLLNTAYLSDLNKTLKDDGTPYLTFSSFSRAWFRNEFDIQYENAPTKSNFLVSGEMNDFSPPLNNTPFKANKLFGNKRLSNYIGNNLLNYNKFRNRMDLDGTSMLSAYFNSGIVDIKGSYILAINLGLDNPGVKSWINELLWREFNAYIMFHFPEIIHSSFNNKLSSYPWEENEDYLNRWKQGLTGFSCVDACMRQLLDIGWMHNRGRMIVASFLTKDLFINWKEGEKWFMENLVDAETASNIGGWQWTAGSGVDAAPYFRIFNPITQGEKFDPNGTYIRKWVPELRDVETKFIHDPSIDNGIYQYPKPIVSHNDSRKKALYIFNSLRN